MSEPPLVDSHRDLDPVPRLILQILALFDGGLSWYPLSDLVKSHEFAKPSGGRLLQSDLRLAIQLLEHESLVRTAVSGQWTVAGPVLDTAVQDAVRSGLFHQLRYAFEVGRANYSRFASAGDGTELRFAFYAGDLPAWRAARKFPGFTQKLRLLDPFAPDLLEKLPEEMQRDFLLDAVPRQITAPRGDRGFTDAFRKLAHGTDYAQADARLVGCWLDLAIATGDLDELRRLDAFTRGKFEAIAGCFALLEGDYDQAERLLGEALPVERNGAKKQALLAMRRLPLPLHLLLLFRRRSGVALDRARRMVGAALDDREGRYGELVRFLEHAVEFCEKPVSIAWLSSLVREHVHSPLAKIVASYVAYWTLDAPDLPNSLGDLDDVADTYRAAGLGWLAHEAATLAPLVVRGAPRFTGRAFPSDEPPLPPGAKSLVAVVAREPAWKRTLASILELARGEGAEGGGEGGAAEPDERLVWYLHVNSHAFDLEPVVQKRTRKGWSVGRKVPTSALLEKQDEPEFAFLSPQDLQLVGALREQTELYYGYPRKKVVLDPFRAARALIGHPAIFLDGDRETPVEIVEHPVKLVVTKHADRLRIRLDPPAHETQAEAASPERGACIVVNEAGVLRLVPDGPHRLGVVLYSPKHRRLNEMLRGQLDVPEEASEQVVESVRALSSLVAVHSEVGESHATLTSTPADPRPHLHLVPHQGGIRVEAYVRPFGSDGPFCRPGQGGSTVFATIEGRPLSAARDLSDEMRRLSAVQSECSFLASEGPTILATPVEALEAVLALDRLRAADQIVLHWPQGGAVRIAGEASTSAFRVQIKKDREWFAASGSLQVDDELTVDMMRLIELVGASSSRFVQLDDGRFLALTDELRKRVREMAAFGEATKTKLRFPGVRAAAWENLGDIQVKADQHWLACVQRMRDAATVEATVPSTLQAELRDYQRAGFQWLASLAEWGVGGCLADDMGLGKTVQAIALLLRRADGGPALVVAPTSVAFNWIKELERFAPTLVPRRFGAGDREAFFQELGPRDVVVTSYGLLHNEAERFQKQRWHTAILDEAQAIKNMATRRSQAAMGLDADFRLIMTGTPLENHLGELWNLFQFINPGLLGSHEAFQERFAGPIERDHDPDARRRLKTLIQPFLLRRTKSQVLTELPSRTELVLEVEPSAEERAFYEALRRSAVQKLEASDETLRGGRHLRILAEIMKLRRACCHPTLAVPDCGLSSSKLTLFSETIDELLDNQHKALVFSQFVDHLQILRRELERKGVAYQYLDGSTPPKERQAAVEAFQSGQGDVFLISLKAGGIGLNLTAADYVLHMDPWWNPAVEDQASDRAHRMGQLRPVTIYRFITQGTIEERITALHASKRDLADSLLEGADVSAKLSAEELLELIRA